MLNCRALRTGINDFSLRYAALLGPETSLLAPMGIVAALLPLLPAMSPVIRVKIAAALGLEESAASFDPPGFLPAESPESALAGALFLDRSVRLSASADASPGGRIELHAVDFSSPSAADAVNAWVDRRTGGLVPAVVSGFPRQTYLALVTALYFADAWAEPFGRTTLGLFRGLSGERTVRFMLADEALYTENDSFQAVLLPTASGGGLCVFLSRDRARRTPVFPADAEAFDALDWRRRPGRLMLPRFRADVGRSCAEDLKRLGLAVLFESGDTLAGLFAGGLPARLDAVLQRSVIRVDEHGLEAAAATAAIAVGAAGPMPEKPFEMLCDRPFSYLLFDRTADYRPCILFTGFQPDIEKSSWKKARSPL